jgi:spermidine synthase
MSPVVRIVYLLVFGSTLFVSAALLFLLQPMVGRLLTPRLGGAPAVWNSCLVFFQLMVLAGYFYVFLLHLLRGIRIQSILHILLWAAGLTAALFGWVVVLATANADAPGGSITQTLVLLTLGLGLPVLVLAATAPLVQRWLAATNLPAGRDPYFLYVAGCLGGLLALAVYPVWLEPHVGLAAQYFVWLGGMGLLGVLLVISLVLAWLAPAREAESSNLAAPQGIAIPADEPAAPRWSSRLYWLVAAALPASLLMGFTTQLTTDVAPNALFWTMPLALFLLTAALGFLRVSLWARLSRPMRLVLHSCYGLALVAATAAMVVLGIAIGVEAAAVGAALLLAVIVLMPYAWVWVLQPVGIAIFIVAALGQRHAPLGPAAVVGQLFSFFLTLRVCHAELARSRPTTPYLTEYYLWMALGGVVGGLFNLALAPLIFRSQPLEFAVVMVLACALRPPYLANGLCDWLISRLIEIGTPSRKGERPLHRGILAVAFDLAMPLAIAVVLLVIFKGGGDLAERLVRPPRIELAWQLGVYGLAMLVCLIVVARPVRFAGAMLFIVLCHSIYAVNRNGDPVLAQERNALGILRVFKGKTVVDAPHAVLEQHYLMHGTTHHGMNFLAPSELRDLGKPHRDFSRLATTYYHRDGPLGNVLEKYVYFAEPNNMYSSDARGPALLTALVPSPLPLEAIVAAAWSEPPIAVIGLGTGTIASYARPWQRMDFYELDPAIIRLCEPEPARRPGRRPFFTFVQEARERGAEINLIPGDARLALARHGPDAFYKVIVVDAFSSDAVPTHLLTVEAIELYLTKLAPGGVLCFYTSNRYLDLPAVLGAAVRQLHLACERGRTNHGGGPAGDPVGMFSSEWVVIARSHDDLMRLLDMQDRRRCEWQPVMGLGRPRWTDDYTPLPEALREDFAWLPWLFQSVLFASLGLMVVLGAAALVLPTLRPPATAGLSAGTAAAVEDETEPAAARPRPPAAAGPATGIEAHD